MAEPHRRVVSRRAWSSSGRARTRRTGPWPRPWPRPAPCWSWWAGPTAARWSPAPGRRGRHGRVARRRPRLGPLGPVGRRRRPVGERPAQPLPVTDRAVENQGGSTVSDAATVGVIFGGPPEHDVSVLTGLQAERCLNDHGVPATGLYWGKGGEFYDVGAGREAASFRDGVPAGAQPLVAGLGPGAERGFARPRKLGAARRRPAAGGRGLLPRRPRRVRPAAGPARPDGRALHRPEPGRGRARDGQAGLRRGRRAGRGARHPPAGPGLRRPGGPGGTRQPADHQAPVRRLVDRRRAGRRPGQRPGAGAVQPAVRGRGAGGAVPQGLVRRQRGHADLAASRSCRRSSGRSAGPARCCPTPTSTCPTRAWPARPARCPPPWPRTSPRP